MLECGRALCLQRCANHRDRSLAQTLFTGQRGRERESEGEIERERERGRDDFFKGMTGALAPLSCLAIPSKMVTMFFLPWSYSHIFQKSLALK